MKKLTGNILSLHCPKWFNDSRRNILLLAVLLLGSFIFKLGLMELGVIVADPARDLAVALGIVDGVKYPLEGPLLGEHLHSGPLYFYVLAIPFFVSKNIRLIFATTSSAVTSLPFTRRLASLLGFSAQCTP